MSNKINVSWAENGETLRAHFRIQEWGDHIHFYNKNFATFFFELGEGAPGSSSGEEPVVLRFFFREEEENSDSEPPTITSYGQLTETWLSLWVTIDDKWYEPIGFKVNVESYEKDFRTPVKTLVKDAEICLLPDRDQNNGVLVERKFVLLSTKHYNEYGNCAVVEKEDLEQELRLGISITRLHYKNEVVDRRELERITSGGHLPSYETEESSQRARGHAAGLGLDVSQNRQKCTGCFGGFKNLFRCNTGDQDEAYRLGVDQVDQSMSINDSQIA